MSGDIVEFLMACEEPEMAAAVENMHNRLEAFASGVDRDCIEAAGLAVEDLTRQRDELLAALEGVIGRFMPCRDEYIFSKRVALNRGAAVIAATRKAMGKCYYAPDGTLMNPDGTRSIFDDVDQ